MRPFSPPVMRLSVFAALAVPCAGSYLLFAQADQETKPVIKGLVRYERRGVSAAPPTGIITAVMIGGASAVASNRAVRGFFKMLAGASALTGRSSMGDMHDFLRSTDQIDMSGWPVKAEYGADAFFTLDEGKDGLFQLKEGNVTWSTRNDTRVELDGGDGNIHILHDKAAGQGSSPLTPEMSSITLETEGKGKDATFTLNLDVGHPMPYDANALWSMMGGLAVLRIEEHSGTQQSHMTMFGQAYSEPPIPGQPSQGFFGYWRQGPLDSVARGREVWLNLVDSPERIEYELFLDCTAEIEQPIENDELVFNDEQPGKIEEYAQADVTPGIWGPSVRWSFPEIKDAKVEPTPENAAGDSLRYSYTGLPEKNSDFKFGDFVTRFESSQASSAGCQGQTRPVAFFFSREAANNPGRPALPPNANRSGPDPNWFYYWLQTKAAQGHAKQIRYSDGTDRNSDGTLRCEPGDYGVYRPETDYIVICNLAKNGFKSFSYPGLGPDRENHGIDAFGVTVRHEWQHYMDYRRFWHARFGRYVEGLDKDGDKIPDRLEAPDSLEPPAPLNKRVKHFNPLVFDSALRGLGDEHTFAWAAEYEYPAGVADTEDWSCEGGHQAFSDKCAEIYTVLRGPK